MDATETARIVMPLSTHGRGGDEPAGKTGFHTGGRFVRIDVRSPRAAYRGHPLASGYDSRTCRVPIRNSLPVSGSIAWTLTVLTTRRKIAESITTS